MTEPIGICQGSGQVICNVITDSDCLDVSRSGHKYYVRANGRSILASRSVQDFMNRSLPVMCLLLKGICAAVKCTKVKCAADKKSQEPFADILRYIKQNPECAEMSVLEIAPDEIQQNMPPQKTADRTIESFQNHVNDLSTNINELRHLSEILLRTNLDKAMWGGKEVGASLGEIRTASAKFGEENEVIDRCVERIDTASRHLKACASVPGAQIRARDLAGKVIENFGTVKGYLSEMAQSLHGLYGVDRVFKAHTGFPATWFMDSSLLMDFQYEYDTLMSNLVKNASLEASFLEPLMAWKIRTAGASQNV